MSSILYLTNGCPSETSRSASDLISEPFPASSSETKRRSSWTSSMFSTSSPAIGTMPMPFLPRLSATSCSAQSPNDASEGDVRIVSLSLPARASDPSTAPNHAPALMDAGRGGPQAISIAAALLRRPRMSKPIKAEGTRPK